jgi:hypothetical protein
VKNQEYDDEILTRYLLGGLAEETTERLDELSITDDEMAARLQLIENDLVDAYVAGDLSGSRLAQFESYYLKSAKRREKVSFARALRVYEGKESGVLVTDSEQTFATRPSIGGGSEGSRWLRFFGSPGRLQWGFAAAALLLLLIGAYLTIENLRLRKEMSQTQAQRVELERRERELQQQLADQRSSDAQTEKELAIVRERLAELEQQLATNANRQGDLKIVAFTLSPQTRGIGQIKPLVLPAGTNYVALALELDVNDFPAYGASLKSSSGQTIWTRGRLTTSGSKGLVRLRIAAELLKPQNYTLELSGITANGTAEIVGSYPFRVVIQ